ncbi:hypothetical protein BJ741DRAFT_582113 [Chytriomyces cf. hyalinus JEL632]|nr:hypothetical protein BJ741DRAFT_582113 [Chytriomyces cf. hyalinus JEL632]
MSPQPSHASADSHSTAGHLVVHKEGVGDKKTNPISFDSGCCVDVGLDPHAIGFKWAVFFKGGTGGICNVGFFDLRCKSTQGKVERARSLLVKAVAKVCHGFPSEWVEWYPAALIAVRILCGIRGETPMKLPIGQDALFPMDFALEAFFLHAWTNLMSSSDLLVNRMLHLQQKQITIQGFAVSKWVVLWDLTLDMQ